MLFSLSFLYRFSAFHLSRSPHSNELNYVFGFMFPLTTTNIDELLRYRQHHHTPNIRPLDTRKSIMTRSITPFLVCASERQTHRIVTSKTAPKWPVLRLMFYLRSSRPAVTDTLIGIRFRSNGDDELLDGGSVFRFNRSFLIVPCSIYMLKWKSFSNSKEKRCVGTICFWMFHFPFT